MTAGTAMIVLAEDDDDDYFLFQRAFNAAGLGSDRVRRVKDGQELLDFLRGYSGSSPLLVLLDLRLPKKNGWEALGEIKSDARLRRVPVVILTSSQAEEEASRAYDLGCNSFITKPLGLDEYTAIAKVFLNYWLGVVVISGSRP